MALTLKALGLSQGQRVLEIGTGSGYAAALLSLIAEEVYTVERIEALANVARAQLVRLGFHNVHVLHGDGTLGWSEYAPYDAIAVAAGVPEIPQSLREQLALGGRLAIPLGPAEAQVLTRVTRESESSYREERITDVCFVPLIGAQGWSESARWSEGPPGPATPTRGPSACANP